MDGYVERFQVLWCVSTRNGVPTLRHFSRKFLFLMNALFICSI